MIGYFTNSIRKGNFLGSFRNTFIDICKCSKHEAWYVVAENQRCMGENTTC